MLNWPAIPRSVYVIRTDVTKTKWKCRYNKARYSLLCLLLLLFCCYFRIFISFVPIRACGDGEISFFSFSCFGNWTIGHFYGLTAHASVYSRKSLLYAVKIADVRLTHALTHSFSHIALPSPLSLSHLPPPFVLTHSMSLYTLEIKDYWMLFQIGFLFHLGFDFYFIVLYFMFILDFSFVLSFPLRPVLFFLFCHLPSRDISSHDFQQQIYMCFIHLLFMYCYVCSM